MVRVDAQESSRTGAFSRISPQDAGRLAAGGCRMPRGRVCLELRDQKKSGIVHET
jgi:hypothetical protein